MTKGRPEKFSPASPMAKVIGYGVSLALQPELDLEGDRPGVYLVRQGLDDFAALHPRGAQHPCGQSRHRAKVSELLRSHVDEVAQTFWRRREGSLRPRPFPSCRGLP